MYFRVFSKVNIQNRDIFWGLQNFKYFFGVFEIPDIFWGWTVDAGSEPTYAEKIRVPPWGSNELVQVYNLTKAFANGYTKYGHKCGIK